MGKDWQCLESHENRLCKKIKEAVENATSTTPEVTTPTPSADLRPASDSDLNLTGMVSSKEDTREPVLKSEKKQFASSNNKDSYRQEVDERRRGNNNIYIYSLDSYWGCHSSFYFGCNHLLLLETLTFRR